MTTATLTVNEQRVLDTIGRLRRTHGAASALAVARTCGWSRSYVVELCTTLARKGLIMWSPKVDGSLRLSGGQFGPGSNLRSLVLDIWLALDREVDAFTDWAGTRTDETLWSDVLELVSGQAKSLLALGQAAPMLHARSVQSAADAAAVEAQVEAALALAATVNGPEFAPARPPVVPSSRTNGKKPMASKYGKRTDGKPNPRALCLVCGTSMALRVPPKGGPLRFYTHNVAGRRCDGSETFAP